MPQQATQRFRLPIDKLQAETSMSGVLFVGGHSHLASVKIRCIAMAACIGAACCTGARSARDIPTGYAIYICVKPLFGLETLAILSARASVVWDVIDEEPPRSYVDLYLVSTLFCKALCSRYGEVALVRHYHCNIENQNFAPDPNRLAWIGYPCWKPDIPKVSYTFFNAAHMSRLDVVKAHRFVGVGLNVRRPSFDGHLHTRYSSGIKLINCIGCGIPSISSAEPGYTEIGDGCTIYVKDLSSIAGELSMLVRDTERYAGMRQRCLAQSEHFHINTVASVLRKVIAPLLA